MKEKRHAKILELIRSRDVGTQEEICELLNQAGFKVTQATVSRDIRELKLTKVSTNAGRQKYISLTDTGSGINEKFARVFRDGVVSIEMAQNILVIKTVSGMAMAVAAALDSMDCREIVGSIAGDDTIMCAVRTVDDTVVLSRRLKRLLNAEQS